jgi:hypothetical protein
LKNGRIAPDNRTIDLRLTAGHDNTYARRRCRNADQAAAGKQ